MKFNRKRPFFVGELHLILHKGTLLYMSCSTSRAQTNFTSDVSEGFQDRFSDLWWMDGEINLAGHCNLKNAADRLVTSLIIYFFLER